MTGTRALWILSEADMTEYGMEPAPTTDEALSTLVSSNSVADPDTHYPIIDLDLPCRLVPSSTSGHFHLYIDAPVGRKRYRELLEALCNADLISEGIILQFDRLNGTFARQPWIAKEGATR